MLELGVLRQLEATMPRGISRDGHNLLHPSRMRICDLLAQGVIEIELEVPDVTEVWEVSVAVTV